MSGEQPKTKAIPRSEKIPRDWPKPMRPEAFDGLAGDVVRMIEPQSEVDPAGLLLQILTAFGNCVGRRPHFRVEADRHGLNLFVVLVGRSAKARKGSSWGHVQRMFHDVDPLWEQERVQSGLSSGEGLVRSVGEDVQDKRLLSLEDEFSAPLKVMTRRGNTLATTLRHAWDGRTMRVMTRHSPLSAVGAHVSAIAHTTETDLGRYLNDTEIFNGFANRFLWAKVQRSKLLPHGGKLPKNQRRRLIRRLREAMHFARQVAEIKLTKRSSTLWEMEYPRLTAEKPGIVGAVCSRAEAQVLRLAAIYALMNGSAEIKVQHLRSGLAVWDYCDESAHYIFGGRRVLTTEDKLLRILPTFGQGLTRTEISAEFHNHMPGHLLSSALEKLYGNGQAKSKRVKTGGRSAERWLAIRGVR